MKIKKVTRYYCDFCRKGMFRKPSMIHHESICTKNSNRNCGMCGKWAGSRNYLELLDKFKSLCETKYIGFSDTDYISATKESIEWLKKQVDNCPACILTILRLGTINAFALFDYKEQCKVFWKEQDNETNCY